MACASAHYEQVENLMASKILVPGVEEWIPPARSHPKAAGDKALSIWVNASTQVQPIPIYSTEETHFGQNTQNALISISITAIPHTMLSRIIPVLPLRTSSQIGV